MERVAARGSGIRSNMWCACASSFGATAKMQGPSFKKKERCRGLLLCTPCSHPAFSILPPSHLLCTHRTGGTDRSIPREAEAQPSASTSSPPLPARIHRDRDRCGCSRRHLVADLTPKAIPAERQGRRGRGGRRALAARAAWPRPTRCGTGTAHCAPSSGCSHQSRTSDGRRVAGSTGVGTTAEVATLAGRRHPLW